MNVFLRRVCFALAALSLCAAATAQTVTYVRDLTLPSSHHFILPENGIATTGETSLLLTNGPFQFSLDPTTNTYTPDPPLDPSIKVNLSSLMSYPGYNASTGNYFLTGPPQKVFTVDPATNLMVTFYSGAMNVNTSTINSLAADNDSTLALVTNNQIYQRALFLNTYPGTVTDTLLINSIANGGRLGTAGKGTFGPDGLFYVLNQVDGVTSVESYDLSAGLAEADRFKSSFTVPSSLSLSAGMAISPTGHMYLGDGSGGLSEYDLSGNFLGNFTFTGSGTVDTSVDAPTGGVAFVSLNQVGDIFVYDPNTGMHEYYDPSGISVPEPSSFGLIMGAGTLAMALARRRSHRA